MKQYCLIVDLESNNYWSESHKDFKGLLFAKKYEMSKSDVFKTNGFKKALEKSKFGVSLIYIYSN